MEGYQIAIIVIIAVIALILIVNHIVYGLMKKKKEQALKSAEESQMQGSQDADFAEAETDESADEEVIVDVELAHTVEDDPSKDVDVSDEVVEEEVKDAVVIEGLEGFISGKEGDDGEGAELFTETKRIYVMYNRSFRAKLVQSDDEVKARYTAVKNALLSYKKTRSRTSWACDTISYGRSAIAKFAVRGKTLSVYLAIDPKALEGTKYKVEDASALKRYGATPTRLKLRSARSAKYAIELVSSMMTALGAVKGEDKTDDYDLAYVGTEELIRAGLIKMLATDEVGTEIAKADFGALSREKFRVVTGLEIRKSVSVTEAASAITDEVAEKLAMHEHETAFHRGTKKGIINIDTLSESFQSGDTVDIIELKEKGLIGKNVGYIKVLARGNLNKSLTVKANDFSLDAVKMIVLTGGAAVIEE
ncbi:MAG: uL15 family ribosomal protein [Clostridia bacterium]|nr:uL15 family ribosomal protein [Clostridia bacterium]